MFSNIPALCPTAQSFSACQYYSSVIAITLSEKEAIREKFPRVHIVRTMKSDSKRHHYYMVEEGAPMRLLRSLRGQERPRDKRKGV